MRPDDWRVVRAIYVAGIESKLATFETAAPAWARWDADHLPAPRIVAEADGKVVGWAAVSAISTRDAYRGVAEVSVYVAPEAQRRGIGRALLDALIDKADHAGLWMLQAAIFARNTASIRLHERCGFRRVGYRERIGRLDGEWLDTVLLERRRQNDGAPPAPITVVRAFIDRINAHDVDGIAALLSEDHRFIDSLGAVHEGRDVLQRGWHGYFGMVTDYRVTVHTVAEAPTALLLLGGASGKSNGVAWTVPAAWRAVVRDGLLAEWQVYADNEPLRASMRA